VFLARPAAVLLLVAFASLTAAPALAHEYWLVPSRWQAAAGDTLVVGARVGTGFRGQARPYAARRAVRFTLIGDRTLDLAPAAAEGALDWASFVIPDERGALIAYQSNFATITLPAGEFDDYLRTEGLNGPLTARSALGAGAGPGRERYARCPKTWIAGARTDTSRVLRPTGLPLEIVPLADPAAARALPVRVLWRGRPLAGTLVRAWNHSPAAAHDSVGPVAESVTDASGEARLVLVAAGEWLIATVHMVPCPEPKEADWESWWASLSFARAARR
jgi:hypothetical protein